MCCRAVRNLMQVIQECTAGLRRAHVSQDICMSSGPENKSFQLLKWPSPVALNENSQDASKCRA